MLTPLTVLTWAAAMLARLTAPASVPDPADAVARVSALGRAVAML